MAEIETNGVPTHVEETGSGAPLVLVHGLGGSSELWRHVAGSLAKEFRVVAYDLRGSGRTPVTGPTSLDELAADLAALIGALGLGRVLLAGHSLGGALVLAYAAAQGETVRGVVGVGAFSELPDAGREGMRARAETVEAEGMDAVAETVATNGTAPSFRERDPEAFAALLASLQANDPAGYAALCRVVAAVDLTAELPRVAAPVLLVAGDLDKVAPPEAIAKTVAAIPGGRSVQLEDCAHLAPLERPRELLDAALPFLHACA